jgi:hypothetical protein
MSAGYQDLFLEQGTSFSTTITLDDVSSNPYNLTGFQAKSQMKKSYYSANATANFVVSITDAVNGLITIGLDSANSANILAGRYVYDVAIKDTSNNVTRVLEGTVNVIPSVTKF